MRALAPWTGIASLRQEMDRLFERFFEPADSDVVALGEWAPKLDLSETKDAVVVKAEVPGIEPKEIQVSVKDQVLTISGEKEQHKEEKDERFYRMECAYGAFSRSLRMPVAVDAGKVTATFKNGLLTVTLPKAPTAKGTTIPVKEA